MKLISREVPPPTNVTYTLEWSRKEIETMLQAFEYIKTFAPSWAIVDRDRPLVRIYKSLVSIVAPHDPYTCQNEIPEMMNRWRALYD